MNLNKNISRAIRMAASISFIGMLLVSCNLEKKLARSFIENPAVEPILVFTPDFVFKVNLKAYEVDSTIPEGDLRRDSILLARSLYLKNLSDSMLIRNFSERFISTLKWYKLGVYTERHLDSLLQAGISARIVNLAQLTVEEYIHPYTNSYEIGDELVTLKEIDLNALNLNVWLEWTVINGSERRNKLLFASDYLTDGISGSFRQGFFTSELSFEYSIDTLTIDRFYKFSGMMGEKCAMMLYDFLMNQEIGRNLPGDYPYERQYYHYDPRSEALYPIVEEDRIIEMEPGR